MAPFPITILLALIVVLLLVVIYLLLRIRTIVIAIHDSLGTTDRLIKKSDSFRPVIHRKVFVIFGCVVGLLVVVAGLVLTLKTKDGILVVEVNEPDSQVQLLNGERQIKISRKVEKGPLTIAINPGRHQLKVQKNGFEIYTMDFDIKAGDKTSIIAKLVPVNVENAKENADRVGNTVETVAFQQWMKDVAVMPPEKQVEAVTKKLMELNPGFGGKVTHKIDNGSMTELQIVTDNVTDISPLRALMGLKVFNCRGSDGFKGKLSDLSPLKGLNLTSLDCGSTNVADLSPLKGMPLTQLCCSGTPVSDLSPLQGMPLMWLQFTQTKVADLSPLRGMPLNRLQIAACPVADISPLKGMPLTWLDIQQTKVADLTPLTGMPLKTLYFADTGVSELAVLRELPLTHLSFDFKPERDNDIIRSIKTLETTNEKPVAEFWKEVEGKKQ